MAFTKSFLSCHVVVYTFGLGKVFELAADAADERDAVDWDARFGADLVFEVGEGCLNIINF